MRRELLILVIAGASCSLSHAEETKFSTTSETEVILKAIVERLEARVTELESELARMKHTQQQAVIGGSLLDCVERPTEQPPVLNSKPIFLNTTPIMILANGSHRVDPSHVDRKGIIRDSRGKPLGYWGVDFTSHDMSVGPHLSR